MIKKDYSSDDENIKKFERPAIKRGDSISSSSEDEDTEKPERAAIERNYPHLSSSENENTDLRRSAIYNQATTPQEFTSTHFGILIHMNYSRIIVR